MATLVIGDRTVAVDDSFLKLSPQQQNATVDEIARSLGPAVAAPQEAPAAPAPAPVAVAPAAPAAAPKSVLQTIREAIHAPTRALENGVMLGLGDRARAVIDSGVEAIGGGGFNYGANLKKQQGETESFAKAHPIAAPVLEGVGGVIAPIGVLSAAAKGTGMLGKIGYGGAAGAGVGAGMGALGSKDWTDLPQVAKDTAIGGGAGLVIGGAVAPVAAGIGASYRGVRNMFNGRADGLSRGAGAHLVSAVEADGPDAVRARLAQLGPDAMLLDTGPSLLGKGQGAALNSDEARSALFTPLTARDASTNGRIMGDVNRALGPAEDPVTVTNAIRAHRSAVDGQNYGAAFANAPAVNPSNVVAELGQMLPNSVGMETRALTNLRDMLMVERDGRLVMQSNPQVLHKIKGELDNVIQYNEPGLGVPAAALSRQQGALVRLRGMLNDTLESQVPGYARANAASAALATRAEAVGTGTQILGSGKTIASPERFAAEFEPLDQGTKIALAKGSRGNIERVLGTKANDLQALRTELQGEGGWNTAKLATVHGQDAADALTATVDRNLAFRNTHNKIVENSQTAQRTAAANAMKPQPVGDAPLLAPSTTAVGLLLGGGKKAANAAYKALLPDSTRSFGEVARVLSSQGAERDQMLQSIVDAIGRRKANEGGGKAVGNAGALLSAMAVDAERRRQLQK